MAHRYLDHLDRYFEDPDAARAAAPAAAHLLTVALDGPYAPDEIGDALDTLVLLSRGASQRFTAAELDRMSTASWTRSRVRAIKDATKLVLQDVVAR